MSYSYDVYNTEGKKLSTESLNAELFNDASVNETAIHEYVVMQEANARYAIASTKTRGEVAGSGKKLYKQKGTGRARVGDKKSPIRRKGGVAFGPRSEQTFGKSMNKKTKRLAIRGLITSKARGGFLLGLDSFVLKAPKTKEAANVLKNIKLDGSKVLIVLPNKDEMVTKSFRNLSNAKYILASYVNPFDLLSHKHILLLGDSMKMIEENVSK